jgi:hypothetical protein
MDRMTKGLAYKSGAFIVVLLVLIIILWSNLNSMITERCENRVVRQIRSPDSSFNAVIFERDCGTAAGISTQVSLLQTAEQLPNKKGNLFIAGGLAKREDVQIIWKDAQKLSLSYRENLQVQKAHSEVLGVHIQYQTSASRKPVSKK